MSDYGKMTDDELRRVIAERLGWTEIEEVSYWAEGYDFTAEQKTLTGKRGMHSDIPVPDWPQSVDAALTLPLKPKQRWMVVQVVGGKTWYASIIDISARAEAIEPARAICEAWLQMMDGAS